MCMLTRGSERKKNAGGSSRGERGGRRRRGGGGEKRMLKEMRVGERRERMGCCQLIPK